MSIDSVRKVLYLVAVTALFVVFCGYAPAGQINNENDVEEPSNGHQ